MAVWSAKMTVPGAWAVAVDAEMVVAGAGMVPAGAEVVV